MFLPLVCYLLHFSYQPLHVGCRWAIFSPLCCLCSSWVTRFWLTGRFFLTRTLSTFSFISLLKLTSLSLFSLCSSNSPSSSLLSCLGAFSSSDLYYSAEGESALSLWTPKLHLTLALTPLTKSASFPFLHILTHSLVQPSSNFFFLWCSKFFL